MGRAAVSMTLFCPPVMSGTRSTQLPRAGTGGSTGTPDFSDVPISLAGEVRRPPVDCAPADIRDLPSIIRVLDRESTRLPVGRLVERHRAPEGFAPYDDARRLDARMRWRSGRGKTLFYICSISAREAVSCAFRKAPAPGDMNFPTYRQVGC